MNTANKNSEKDKEHDWIGLAALFGDYSVSDVATSIFVSSLWLPNIASPAWHLLVTAAFASTKQEHFRPVPQIKSYGDFRSFLTKLYSSVPSLPMLDDFVPETDWGDVKFWHNGRSYRILYGNEYSYIYDFLMAFKLVHLPIENKIKDILHRSPGEELGQVLRIQDAIITGIRQQPQEEHIRISPGHIEVPPENFWLEATNYYDNLNFHAGGAVSVSFLNAYTHDLGAPVPELASFDTFGNAVMTGRVLRALFVRDGDKRFMVLPRRHSSILKEHWSGLTSRLRSSPDRSKMQSTMMHELHEYISARVRVDLKESFVSAMKTANVPSDMIFASGLAERGNLALLAIPPAFSSAKETEAWLRKLKSQLDETISLFMVSPFRLLCRSRREIVGWDRAPEKIVIFVVLPSMPEGQALRLPKDFPAKVMDLPSFLGIIDETHTLDQLMEFAAFVDEEGRLSRGMHTSYLDIYAAFKGFNGVMVQGALEPHFIQLDVTMGSQMRFKTLSDFWKDYPDGVRWDDPRSWDVERSTPYTRLIARGCIHSELYTKIGKTLVSAGAPFKGMEYEEMQISDFLMECAISAMADFGSTLKDHPFFRENDHFHLWFCPKELADRSDKLKHIRHLSERVGTNLWVSDWGCPQTGEYGVRIIFNMPAIKKAFLLVPDRRHEISLLLEVLEHVNSIRPADLFVSLQEQIEKASPLRARFVFFEMAKEAAFPEGVATLKPEVVHLKLALKRISELAKANNVVPGEYAGEDAKHVLNTLRDAVIPEINTLIQAHALSDAAPFVITRIDALINEFTQKRKRVEFSVSHDVDYDRAGRLLEYQADFISHHRTYRYLIEKLVQLKPSGDKILDEVGFRFWSALSHWIQRLYIASDNIHYAINPSSLHISHDYVLTIKEVAGSVEHDFECDRLRREIGMEGREQDSVDPDQDKALMSNLDKSFIADCGFSFGDMLAVLTALAAWPSHFGRDKAEPCYSATKEELCQVLPSAVTDLDPKAVDQIVSFLSLDPLRMTKVLGDPNPSFDIPVWEHRKRAMRYNLRPLIPIEGKLLWGPWSVLRSRGIWTGPFFRGTLPYDMNAPHIQQIVDGKKREIDRALETKGEQIIRRFTEHVRTRCDLHNLNSVHPANLGDYDILAFDPRSNNILNVECKDNPDVFCLKDMRRLRERIFGNGCNDRGHFEHILRREEHIRTHLAEVAQTLGWPILSDRQPGLQTIYVTRREAFVTRQPPTYAIATRFVEIERFHALCESICGIKKS